MILVGVTSLACIDNYDRQNYEKKKKKDTDSREPVPSLSNGSLAAGTGVSVPRREQEQEAEPGTRRADEAGPGQDRETAETVITAQCTGDLGHDLLLTTGAGDGLRFGGELDFRTGSLRIVLSWTLALNTGSVD